MQVWRTATNLGLYPDGGFNEHDLNQQNRRMVLLLHPNAAARNEVSLEEATSMFQYLRNERDLICDHLQNDDHHLFLLMWKVVVMMSKHFQNQFC